MSEEYRVVAKPGWKRAVRGIGSGPHMNHAQEEGLQRRIVEDRLLLCIGFLCLAVGLLFYICYRPIHLISAFSNLTKVQRIVAHIPLSYGEIESRAPDFFHPLAMSLITMSFVSDIKTKRLLCLIWYLIDSLFEGVQLFGLRIVTHIPSWFERLPVIEKIDDYLACGRFDAGDLLAIALGSITALVFTELRSRKGDYYE